MAITSELPAAELERRDALAGRFADATNGAFDLFTAYLGDRLGLYRALADGGPLSAGELAARTGTDSRQVREWLEQQTIAEILELASEGPPDERRFRLPAGHAEVLLDQSSLAYLAPLPRMVASLGRTLDPIVQSFRTGAGVAWSVYGSDAREGQADMNRPVCDQLLGRVWLPAIEELDARLRSGPPARVADVACGAGWSSQAIARAYPTIQVDGYDIDEASIELARDNLARFGTDVADRVRFHLADAADSTMSGDYAAVTILEALHDMAHPVQALRTVRDMLCPDGTVVIIDERTAESFGAVGDPTERTFYGWSVLCCLPAGLSEPDSAGTGTVMRPATVERYAREAGFSRFDILPIEHETFRLYRLRP
ncbi:MAG: methyltransferase domain-containing protein [Chloroflexota bacterium]|nr:methyltransferase domain-containing protein [Chloroflexota bacterium]